MLLQRNKNHQASLNYLLRLKLYPVRAPLPSSDFAVLAFLLASILAKRDCGFALQEHQLVGLKHRRGNNGECGGWKIGRDILHEMLALILAQLFRARAHDVIGRRDVRLL